MVIFSWDSGIVMVVFHGITMENPYGGKDGDEFHMGINHEIFGD